MENRMLAGRYARALFKFIDKDSSHEDMENILSSLKKGLESDPLLVTWLANASIQNSLKLQIILKSIKQSSNKTLERFLKLLANKNRLDHLIVILEEYFSLINKAKGIIKGDVISAIGLSNEQVSELENKLEQKWGRKFILHPKIDTTLLGGFLIRIDDQVYDFSIKHALSGLRSRFMKLNVQGSI